MSVCERVSTLISTAGVPFELFPHREAHTAQQVAETSHVPGRMMAKVVVLKDTAGQFIMAVLPATRQIDLELLRPRTGRAGLTLASESELQRLFVDCELGAEPPFGNLYGLPTYLDGCFFRESDICFQAGNHREGVRMKFEDYLKLVRPLAGEYCLHPEMSAVGT